MPVYEVKFNTLMSFTDATGWSYIKNLVEGVETEHSVDVPFANDVGLTQAPTATTWGVDGGTIVTGGQASVLGDSGAYGHPLYITSTLLNAAAGDLITITIDVASLNGNTLEIYPEDDTQGIGSPISVTDVSVVTYTMTTSTLRFAIYAQGSTNDSFINSCSITTSTPTTSDETATINGIAAGYTSPINPVGFDVTWPIINPQPSDVITVIYDDGTDNFIDSDVILNDTFDGAGGTPANARDAAPVPNDGTRWTGTDFTLDGLGNFRSSQPNTETTYPLTRPIRKLTLNITNNEFPVASTRFPGLDVHFSDATNRITLNWTKLTSSTSYRLDLSARVNGVVVDSDTFTSTLDFNNPLDLVVRESDGNLEAFFPDEPALIATIPIPDELRGATLIRLRAANLANETLIASVIADNDKPLGAQNFNVTNCANNTVDGTYRFGSIYSATKGVAVAWQTDLQATGVNTLWVKAGTQDVNIGWGSTVLLSEQTQVTVLAGESVLIPIDGIYTSWQGAIVGTVEIEQGVSK